MKKDLLKMSDLTAGDINEILTLASEIKAKKKQGIEFKPLVGKTLGMIFQKASTRTRVSFEAGMVQLGGYPLFLNANDMQLGRGEPIVDTANVLSRYLDGIMIRTFEQSDVEELAEHASIPIINGLTDYEHPCQILADLLTIKEHKGVLEGLKVVFIGDGNNVANSLIIGGLTMGMEVVMACPKGYEPHADVLAFAKAYGDAYSMTDDVTAAAKDADVLFTDVWASMGQEDEAKKRQADFAGYQINAELMALAKPDAMVQHCLPAHRGEEITADVFDQHADEIYDEAENRMHAQNAVLTLLMG